LAEALAAGSLSEREKFHYLLVWTVVASVVGQVIGTSLRWDRLRLMSIAPGLLINLVGLLACFKANARGDNRAFLERYVCLSVPVGLVVGALHYLLYYGMGFVGLRAGWVAPDARNWDATIMALIASMATLMLFWVWMWRLIARAAGLRTV
jgi:hypothetical protein